MAKYGQMLYKGIGIGMNRGAAAEYFKQAADKGNVTSMINYADMLDEGE